jgi:Fe(3+) dicitrate transport protein
VPTGGTTFVNEDLKEGSSWQGEIGLRGQPAPFLTWDTSLFWMEFTDQIGSVPVPGGTSVENVGDTVHKGFEASLELELIGLADALRGAAGGPRAHTVSLYGNLMWLDAEIVRSPTAALVGNAPQYAPDYITRAGLIYRWKDRAKLAFTGTFVDTHFADDANSASFRVPAYAVWDLTAEFKVYRDSVSVIAGVNNLFDERYFSRVRSDGIDPAYGRNVYVGLALQF